MDSSTPLLQVENLSVEFAGGSTAVRAVEDVTFEVRAGEVLGVVGESGCGKSVTALSLLRLVPSPPGRTVSGRAIFDGLDLLQAPIADLRRVRGGRIGFIFQDPMSALSPLHPIGRQMVEALRLHRRMSRADAWALGTDWLQRVGIPDPVERMRAYPYELSGGMRQRVMIAMALMLQPDLIIADEPTTALDVTIQAQIFDLIRAMKDERTALLLITHDMGVIWEMCDRVMVMYASRIVETGPVRDLFATPRHPYTAGLLRCMPRLKAAGKRLPAIPGQVPAPGAHPPGCAFSDRCAYVMPRCRAQRPELLQAGSEQRAACFLVEEGRLP